MRFSCPTPPAALAELHLLLLLLLVLLLPPSSSTPSSSSTNSNLHSLHITLHTSQQFTVQHFLAPSHLWQYTSPAAPTPQSHANLQPMILPTSVPRPNFKLQPTHFFPPSHFTGQLLQSLLGFFTWHPRLSISSPHFINSTPTPTAGKPPFIHSLLIPHIPQVEASPSKPYFYLAAPIQPSPSPFKPPTTHQNRPHSAFSFAPCCCPTFGSSRRAKTACFLLQQQLCCCPAPEQHRNRCLEDDRSSDEFVEVIAANGRSLLPFSRPRFIQMRALRPVTIEHGFDEVK